MKKGRCHSEETKKKMSIARLKNPTNMKTIYKKLILTICFCLVATMAHADHWVYIRLEDKFGVTVDDTKGRSKEGDIVDIRYADYEPSDLEKQEWAIVKVSGLTDLDIEEYKKAWIINYGTPQQETKAYRKYKLKNVWIKNLSVGIFPQIINVSIVHNNIKLKDDGDIALYEHRQNIKPILFTNLHKQYLEPWLDFWVRKAYAAVACADDSTSGEQICTINWGSQDYDTFTLWEDAKDGDLVTATQIRTSHLYNDDGDLADNLTIDGSATSATYYMKVSVPVAERHNGTNNDAATLVESADADIIIVSDTSCIIEWLIVESTATNNYNNCIYLASSNDSIARNNVCRISPNSYGGHGIDTAWRGHINNNIVYGASANYGAGIVAGGANSLVYNNTVVISGNKMRGIAGNAGTLKNNIVFVTSGTRTTDYFDIDGATGENNIGADGTAADANWSSGTDNLESETATDQFTTIDSDLHLKTGADAIDAGQDLGTGYGVNFDIDNRDRDAEGDTWDIGADEFVSAEPAAEGNTILYNDIKVFGSKTVIY